MTNLGSMKYFKILNLSTILFLANCSFIGDKFSKKQPEDNDKQEEVAVLERVYVEDNDLKEEKKDKKKSNKGEFLKGDIQMEEDYPNLANVPERPNSAISIEEQKQIIKNLKDENIESLEPVRSESVKENYLTDAIVDESNNRSNLNTTGSTREIVNQRLAEYDANYRSTGKVEANKEEEELHRLARSLKNMKSEDDIVGLEKQIQKNIYSPVDIENILGLKGLGETSSTSLETNKEKRIQTAQIKNTNKDTPNKTSVNQREVPIARISFSHGSADLTDTDLQKIKNIIRVFNENEGKKLVIVGHSSSRTLYDMDLTKHAITNFNMSLERANSVMKEFSTVGLKTEKMEVIAMSDAEPLNSEIMPSLEAANRRAEIFIKY